MGYDDCTLVDEISVVGVFLGMCLCVGPQEDQLFSWQKLTGILIDNNKQSTKVASRVTSTSRLLLFHLHLLIQVVLDWQMLSCLLEVASMKQEEAFEGPPIMLTLTHDFVHTWQLHTWNTFRVLV